MNVGLKLPPSPTPSLIKQQQKQEIKNINKTDNDLFTSPAFLLVIRVCERGCVIMCVFWLLGCLWVLCVLVRAETKYYNSKLLGDDRACLLFSLCGLSTGCTCFFFFFCFFFFPVQTTKVGGGGVDYDKIQEDLEKEVIMEQKG